ncbi:MAG: hypothetical protein U9N11_03775 [Campylobacterota bacterium]|nr:hypothetical protein [Campylobacterota bacterium]
MKSKLTDEEKEDWLKKKNIDLFISDEYFHHHAFEIVNTYSELKEKLTTSLKSKIDIDPRIKRKKQEEFVAIGATKLNIEIRKLLQNIQSLEIKFEVYEENGVFYFSSEKSAIGGFDFAILNHHKNLIALRNLCFGSLQYADGEARWNKFLEKNKDLQDIANALKNLELKGQNIYNDIESNEAIPLIVGEIQFGNWALAYRDFFKVLKADVQNSVDCLIYIVPTGNLESMLSEGIVTFEKSKKIIEDFSKVISVPVWLIGIDATVKN